MEIQQIQIQIQSLTLQQEKQPQKDSAAYAMHQFLNALHAVNTFTANSAINTNTYKYRTVATPLHQANCTMFTVLLTDHFNALF